MKCLFILSRAITKISFWRIRNFTFQYNPIIKPQIYLLNTSSFSSKNAKQNQFHSPRQHTILRIPGQPRLQNTLMTSRRLHPQKTVLPRRRLTPTQYARYGEIRRSTAALLRRGVLIRCCLLRLPISGFYHWKTGDISEGVRLRRRVPAITRFRTGHNINFDRVRL